MSFQKNISTLTDSIKSFSDIHPVKLLDHLRVDSTLVTDTIKNTDSIPVNENSTYLLYRPVESNFFDSTNFLDTLKNITHKFSGFDGIPHPNLPQNESWIFVIIMLLFFVLVFSVSSSKTMLLETIRTFAQAKERSSLFSNATVNDFRFRFFLNIFSIAVLSLYGYLTFYEQSNNLSITAYLSLLVFTLFFFGIKSLLIDFIGFVFLDTTSLKIAKESYFNIISFAGIILFPLLLLHIYAPSSFDYAVDISSLIVCLLVVLLLFFKLFQIFFNKIASSFYILLYLCTLEFIPFLLLYYGYKLIIKVV